MRRVARVVWLLGAADERVLAEGAFFTGGATVEEEAFVDRVRDLLSTTADVSDEAGTAARVRVGFLAFGVERVLSSYSVSEFALAGAAAAGLFFFVTLTVVDVSASTSSALATAAGACFLVRKGRGITAFVEEVPGVGSGSVEFFLSMLRNEWRGVLSECDVWCVGWSGSRGEIEFRLFGDDGRDSKRGRLGRHWWE